MDPDLDRPLLSFCVNNSNLWPQDLENVKLDHRVQDVLAQRTNMFDPRPLPSREYSQQPPFAVQPSLKQEVQLDRYGQNGLQFPMFLDSSGHPSLISPYSPYDNMIMPHQTLNLLDISEESRLMFPLNAPQIRLPPKQGFPTNVPHMANRDCMTPHQIESLKRDRNFSNRQLFQDYNRAEIRHSAYPDLDRNLFDNTSKEILKTRDDRNQFMIYTINDQSL